MKKVLYIGNKLEKHGASPTSVDTLPELLKSESYYFKAVSSYKNKFLRVFHMWLSILKGSLAMDIVLIDTYSTTNFWYAASCGFLCRCLSMPYIFVLHGGNLQQRIEKSSTAVINLFRRARANIVPSGFLLEKMEFFGFKNLVVIPNSINLSEYPFKVRKDLQPKILWVRAFAEVYKPGLALEVLENLLKIYPEAELCMVGPEKDGSLKRIKHLVAEKKLPVKIKGKLSKKDWIALSIEYDIFLNTTSVDNTPVSVLEAMALGLPVISTNVGGIPYLIKNEKHGILVPPNNSKAMVKAILKMLNHPEFTRRITRNGREKVEKFDWNQVKPLWLKLLG